MSGSKISFTEHCDGNVLVYDNFLTDEECDRLVSWLKDFNYDGLPNHMFKFWGKRLIARKATTSIPGYETSFDPIKDLDDSLIDRVRATLNELEVANWEIPPFNYIKMWNGSDPFNYKQNESLEMYYHVDNQEHMEKVIFWGAVVYPNDDYEGGSIYYPQYDFRYKPKKGSLVLHEGFTRHGVEKVLLGNRFCMTSFITKEDGWNPDPKPVSTGNAADPWFYPSGYNGVRMPGDPKTGDVSIPRPDGSLANYKAIQDAANGDASVNRQPGDTRRIQP